MDNIRPSILLQINQSPFYAELKKRHQDVGAGSMSIPLAHGGEK
jgi:hypothetical protein